MRDTDRVLGIIAGAGDLPLHIARSLSGSGNRAFVIALENLARPELEDPDWETEWVDFYRLGDLLASLRNAGVSQVVLAGHVAHRGIYQEGKFDARMLSFLGGLEDRRGGSILLAFVRLLEKEGYEVPSLLKIVPSLVPSKSHTMGPTPDSAALDDLTLGWFLARQLADLEIGQAVVIKNAAVVAVEGMEGTDETVKRAINMAGKGLTVVKRAAKNHDFRFDVPTIGTHTVEVLAGGGGGNIVVEAGRCFILDREEVIALCEKTGVRLMVCREKEDGAISWDSGS
ncbi:MAG: UDP-2,3-diacylglucosamine diphosphatase LpxI [Proteobacteria bacterium]|nr:UDP-2,3-diacylglucosamine diphosphatase LpxI [Pseudomonadota bacterium]